MTKKQDEKAETKQAEVKTETDNAGVEIIREDKSTTTDTNASPEAQQGTIAGHDITGTAPESHAADNVDTNAGK